VPSAAPGSPRIRVLPSLLACDFSRLGEEIERVEKGGADGLHLDVMDGHFVPNLTIGPPLVEAARRRSKAFLDCHLMVTDPLAAARWFAAAGVDSITFHAEVAPDGALVAEAIRGLGKQVGVALNPDTPAKAAKALLPRVDQVLVMTVFPGFGGQKFLDSAVPKIRELRDLGFAGDVAVDGGIQEETAARCAEAGANVFVAGTFVFRAKDPAAAIRGLRSRAEQARARASKVAP
jgi:ribulose-phosphate 3-epimerase